MNSLKSGKRGVHGYGSNVPCYFDLTLVKLEHDHLVMYFLKWYKEPTFFSASIATYLIYMFN